MTLNIAHRGARSLAPENTLAAAKKALKVGADMWELDVSITADDELIVMHDSSLTRTTNADEVFPNRAPWHVSDFTLAEIKQLDTSVSFIRNDPFEQIAAGRISVDDLAAMQGEPIPTLREALQFTRDHSWQVNVEIKVPSPKMQSFPLAESVAALIDKIDMVEQAIVSSFIPLYIHQVKILIPAIKIAVLTSGPLSLATKLHYAPPDVAEITPMHYFPGENPLPFLQQINSTTYHPHYPLFNQQEIIALQKTGIAVNVWTVNDKTHMQRLVAAGIDGIITDFPQVLQQVIDT